MEGGESLILEERVLPSEIRLQQFASDQLGVVVVVKLRRRRRKRATVLLDH
jgi:hypothetical protein